jgi:large subunit ribosomal protein L16
VEQIFLSDLSDLRVKSSVVLLQTSKPAEVPMGGGKGELQGYCMEVLPGRILFEVDGVAPAVAREALRKAGTKLPVKTRIIARD